nr:uncharacterized protein LOC109152581 [Ipomoea batatas]
MVQKLAQITIKNQNVSYACTPSRTVMMCDLCGGEHNSGECFNDDTSSQSSMEHVDLVGYGRQQQSFQPQGAYNPNAPRNHPGFSWSNPNGPANPQSYGNRNPPPGFQGQQNFRGGQTQPFRPTQGFQPQVPTIQPRPPLPTLEAPPPSNWEAMMEMMVKSLLQSEERFRLVTEKLDQLSVHNKMLENQIANQASTSSTKVTGKFPACPENPREHVNAIVTRSGKKVEEPPLPVDKPRPSKIIDVEIEERLEDEEANHPILNASPQSHEKDEKEKLERKYQTCISKRPIKPERGIEIVAPDAWNWGNNFLAQPGDAFDSIVREFYANAKDGVETHQCIIRGVAVDFSPAAINAYYGTTNHGGYDYYHRDLRPGRITQEDLDNIAQSYHHDAGWNIRNGVAAHMDYRFFFPLDRAIIDFIRVKLIPNSHRGNVKRDLVFLTYCIKEQRTIDVGRLISRSISEIAQAEAKSRCYLGHPSLITELCRLAGVPIIENQERMQKMRPAAHALDQFPPPYNMEQFFARQEEFMRRHEEFMTRHEGYMRRSDDINWFVGKSAHQHNLAAQGLTPQFPPPPPWLQDPQFISAYYTS